MNTPLLHPTANSYKDAIHLSRQIGDKVYGVYLRVVYRIGSDNQTVNELAEFHQAKVGKGFVYDGQLTRNYHANCPGILKTLDFIPTSSSVTAFTLERYIHERLEYFRVQQIGDENERSGTEWFQGWSADEKQAVKQFRLHVIRAINEKGVYDSFFT